MVTVLNLASIRLFIFIGNEVYSVKFSSHHDSFFNYLNFKTLYSIWQSLVVLLLITVCINKINCLSIMHTLTLLVPTKQIRGFSNFNAIIVSSSSFSSRRVSAVNNIVFHYLVQSSSEKSVDIQWTIRLIFQKISITLYCFSFYYLMLSLVFILTLVVGYPLLTRTQIRNGTELVSIFPFCEDITYTQAVSTSNFPNITLKVLTIKRF
jgi:hypothetical protein